MGAKWTASISANGGTMIAPEARFAHLVPPESRWEPVLESAMEKGGKLEQATTDLIRRYPAWSIGLALAVGVLLGCISKRR
jgi:hypothetical protein